MNLTFNITWVRRRDWHILTSGVFTYTNDERFQVLHSEGSDDWTLQIKYVQKRDNGTYECQEVGHSLLNTSSTAITNTNTTSTTTTITTTITNTTAITTTSTITTTSAASVEPLEKPIPSVRMARYFLHTAMLHGGQPGKSIMVNILGKSSGQSPWITSQKRTKGCIFPDKSRLKWGCYPRRRYTTRRKAMYKA
ncbi:unnamed protein product [Nesidiocoris tenuis]|uniref:Ig-like domain-containing protein n=1 Tax=Nesidiocoris tenuis TaxID=355587 RepID=A0A6H5G5V7_9HEMI|nr:unnamed protein product [Nesidiocoris tenuis]